MVGICASSVFWIGKHDRETDELIADIWEIASEHYRDEIDDAQEKIEILADEKLKMHNDHLIQIAALKDEISFLKGENLDFSDF